MRKPLAQLKQISRRWTILLILLLAVGCGAEHGVNCWEAVGDSNEDGREDVLDCIGPSGEEGSKGKAGKRGEAGSSYADSVLATINTLGENVDAVLDVLCVTERARGTGTKTKDGTVITAAHVLEPTCAQIEFYSGGVLVGTGSDVGRKDPVEGRDLSVLNDIEWTDEGEKIKGFTPIDDWNPGVGEQLLLISHPLDLRTQPQYTTGFVTGEDVSETLKEAGGDIAISWSEAFTTDLVSTNGSSGGPVFDQEGDWVAMLVGGYNVETGFDLNFVIPLRF